MGTKRGPVFVAIEVRHLSELRELDLSRSAHELYKALLLFPVQTKVPGVLRAGLGTLRDELPAFWTESEIVEALNELTARGLVLCDTAAKVIYLPALQKMHCNRPISEPQAASWGNTLESLRSSSMVFEIAERNLLELLRASGPSKHASYLAGRRLHGEDAEKFLAAAAVESTAPAALPASNERQLPFIFPSPRDPESDSPRLQAREHPSAAVPPPREPDAPAGTEAADAVLAQVWPDFAQRTGILGSLRRHFPTITHLRADYDERIRAGWAECQRAGIGPEAWDSVARHYLGGHMPDVKCLWALLADNLLGVMRDVLAAERRVVAGPTPRRAAAEPARAGTWVKKSALSRVSNEGLRNLVVTWRAHGLDDARIAEELVSDGASEEQLAELRAAGLLRVPEEVS
jgi:hypothetical protein